MQMTTEIDNAQFFKQTLSKAEIARREKEIIESLERSEQLKQQQQQQQLQYTWQDHMAEETTMTEEQKQLSEHLEYQVVSCQSLLWKKLFFIGI